jgi:Glycogen recognition site of AMP-activated protein kinase
MSKTTKKSKTAASAPSVIVKSEAPRASEPPKAPVPIKFAEPPPRAAQSPIKPAEPTKAAEPVKPSVPKPPIVCLEIVRPGAKNVCVAGTFNEWKPERTPLVARGNGRWVGDLAVKPGRYEYLFVVDGNWEQDPNAQESVQNPFGGRNSVLVAKAA